MLSRGCDRHGAEVLELRTLGVHVAVNQGRSGPGATRRTAQVLVAIGLLAGLSACASGTMNAPELVTANTRSNPVAAASVTAPPPKPGPDQGAAGAKQDRAPRSRAAAEVTAPVKATQEAKPAKVAMRTSGKAHSSPRPLPPEVANIEPVPSYARSVAKTTKVETAAFHGSRSAVATSPQSAQPTRKYRTRSAFPTSTGASPKPRTRGVDAGSENSAFRTVPVFWATNRVPEASPKTEPRSEYQPVSFGSDRADGLTKGLALVTIPNIERDTGVIPRPQNFTLFGFTIYREKENPEKHFTIRSLVRMDDADFLKLAAANLDRARDFKGHCFVYVHGYRNTFANAIYRAAQIAEDMGFDGNPFVYSWPSQGNLAGYIADRDAVDASQPHFQRFLRFVNDKTTCEQVHVLAHSMGTRLVVDAFFPPSGAGALNDLGNVGQIVLASPDIDASILRSRAEAIRQSPRTVTLYANGRDDALQWSKKAAAGFVRAGDVVDGKPTVIEGIDTIDLTPMSDATWVFIGANHNEYAERAHILQDIALLMKDGVRPPTKRFPVYTVQSLDGGKFWRYVTN